MQLASANAAAFPEGVHPVVCMMMRTIARKNFFVSKGPRTQIIGLEGPHTETLMVFGP